MRSVIKQLISSCDWGFASGAGLLILGFVGLSQLSSSASAAKQILGETTVSFESLQAQDLSAARSGLDQASQKLNQIQDLFNVEELVLVGRHLIKALELLQKERNLAGSFRWDPGSNISAPEFFEALAKFHLNLTAAQNELAAADKILENLPVAILPADKRREAEEGLSLLDASKAALHQAVELSGLAVALLGGEPKTYLLIFQNNNEARATGGFIGTYGLLTLGQGMARIEKIESVYALDGQLRELIAAPGPLQRIATPYWGMRDANWFADFPASARKILEFLEKENGMLAEGIISFTPDVFEQLLDIAGPVAMPEYDEILTAENFRQVVQYKTSIDYDRQQNQPKKFLADFAPRFLSRLADLNEGQRIRLAEVFLSAVAEKHFLMFSLDGELEAAILRQGAGGELRRTPGDFLAIFHSSVGGGKTDQGIEQSVEKTVRIDRQGRQSVNLKITRTHQAANELYFPRNVDFMRIFVPAGSKLMSASGFDSGPLSPSVRSGSKTDADLAHWDGNITRDQQTGIYVGRESGYTVFMDWLTLDPGEAKTVELEYILPQVGREYSLLLQKQPGAREFAFKLDVIGIDHPAFQHPPVWPISEIVDTDRFYAVVGE